jgi:hypothetical protein
MKLPERIPKRLRESALVLPEFDDGEGAWSRDEAMDVIESLKGTTVAVSDVVVFNRILWGYAPSESALSIDRLSNESDADYSARSRLAAANFIRGSAVVNNDSLFALTFPMWKEAA